jgi:hypothetical protein
LVLRQVDQAREQLVLRNVGKQRVDVGDADLGQHGLAIGIGERQSSASVGLLSYAAAGGSITTSSSTELAM